MDWRDRMGMRETAEQVAWRMVLGGYSDEEIKAEMTRLTVGNLYEDPREEWSIEEISAAITAARANDPGDQGSRLARWNAEQDEEADRFVESEHCAGLTVVAAGRHLRDAVQRHRTTMRRETTKAQVLTSAPLYVVPRPAAPRPRARRDRHVARSTSSASSGDPELPDDLPLARLSRAVRRARFERVPGSVAVRLVFRPERNRP